MASQQFCLKWNNHQTNMLSVFEELLSSEAFVDVTLACDGLSLKAHKIVLSACSHFFQSLFLENPCKHPIVIMKDVSYKDLKAIIDFMYHGEVNVSQDQLSTLLKTAEMLKVKGLAEVSGDKQQGSDSGNVNEAPAQATSQQQARVESPSGRKRKKRPRTRHRSDSDSGASDDESVPSRTVKEPASPEIEELSGDTSMNAYSRTSSRSSAASSRPKRSTASYQNVQNTVIEDEFESVPAKLLEQTLSDAIPTTSASIIPSASSGHFNFSSSSGVQISEVGNESQALVPAGDPNHMNPSSPLDIKPEIYTLEEEDQPSSPVAGPSHETDMSVMLQMDHDSMSEQGYPDNQMVVQDAQSQEKTIFKCCYCPKCFSTKLETDRHLKRCHTHQIKPGRLRCAFCEYSTNNRQNLKRHLLTHTGKNHHKCDVCGKGFARKTALENHVISHTGTLLVQCEFCSKCFATLGDVNKHQRLRHLSQLKECQFQCETCSYSTDNKSNLNRHMLKHTGEKRFQCDLCEKSFAFKYHLKDHHRTHTGERPYKCEHCPSAFSSQTNLFFHVKRHLQLKSHLCPTCGRGFISVCDLKRHVLTHQKSDQSTS